MSATDTPRHPWLDLIQTADAKFLESVGDDALDPAAEAARERLRSGMTGASEAEITQHQERLGVGLPPSYRQFLRVTNGWDVMEDPPVHLAPLAKIGWLRDLDPHLATMWSDQDPRYSLPHVPDEEYFVYGADQDPVHLRPEYVPDTLRIGEYDDGVLLLNPRVKTADGEWEAWYMAPWLAGAQRFRSFWDLMNDQLREDTETP
ncbi:SMI1/KNR4 family protein [Streptosporangium sp. KLBMP 9127]|nr:SMI1/KNR4 family protein [Streptosporangium sp. KLBMP 9127]